MSWIAEAEGAAAGYAIVSRQSFRANSSNFWRWPRHSAARALARR